MSTDFLLALEPNEAPELRARTTNDRVERIQANEKKHKEEKKKKARPAAIVIGTLWDNTPDFVVTFLEWLLHKEADEEDAHAVWWFKRKQSAHLPIVIGVLAFCFCLAFYASGFFGFLFRTGYVQDEINIVEGSCSACLHAISVFEYPDEAAREWMRALDKTKSLTSEDGARGWFTIREHWAYDGPMNVSLAYLYPLMRKESENKRCDCAVHHGVPANTFAYNGVVYVAHHISGVRGSATSCGVRGTSISGDDILLDVNAEATGVVRYWDNACEEHKADASHALLCCARLCQLPPKNLLQ